MGHHTHAGNCEWDVVVVCRPIEVVTEAVMTATVEGWQYELVLGSCEVSAADLTSFGHALAMAKTRFGRLPTA
jgi:hypothetical protein